LIDSVSRYFRSDNRYDGAVALARLDCHPARAADGPVRGGITRLRHGQRRRVRRTRARHDAVAVAHAQPGADLELDAVAHRRGRDGVGRQQIALTTAQNR